MVTKWIKTSEQRPKVLQQVLFYHGGVVSIGRIDVARGKFVFARSAQGAYPEKLLSGTYHPSLYPEKLLSGTYHPSLIFRYRTIK